MTGFWGTRVIVARGMVGERVGKGCQQPVETRTPTGGGCGRVRETRSLRRQHNGFCLKS